MELVLVMQQISGIYPAQSGVERKNGLIESVLGAKRKNRMLQPSRLEHVFVSDYYKKKGRIQLSSKADLFKYLAGRGADADIDDHPARNQLDDLESEESDIQSDVVLPEGTYGNKSG